MQNRDKMKSNHIMTMNTRLLIRLLPAMIFPVLLSCTEEVQEETLQDLENCYGVYFLEESGNTGDIEVAPSDEKSLTFTLLRLNDDDDITVPVKVSSNHDGIFAASEARFEDGQSETTFTVSFPKVEKGTEYTCTVSIDDPLYALKYGRYPTSAEFSVTVVQWNRLSGTGKWRDDFISSMYPVSNAFAEKDITVYERDDRPGYYRIDHVYTEEYLALLLNGDEAYASTIPPCEEVYTYVDATDPEKVYFPYQSTGMLLSSTDGAISMASDVPEIFGEQSAGVYGTLDNGIISFPQFAILANFSNEPESWYSANVSGNTRIILPGYRAYDYSVTLLAGQTAASGLLPVSFTLGQDVKSVKWAIYKTRLPEMSVASLSKDLFDGKAEPAGTVTASGSIGVSPDPAETGIYTLVTANMDRYGNYQGYSFVSFAYMSNDDPVPVVVSGGLIVSDKYAPQGYTSENSMEFYIQGKDLEEMRMALIKRSDAANMHPEDVAESMRTYIDPLPSAQLDSVNTVGYTGIVGDLVPGTEYGLYILSTNGYQTALNVYTASTKGTPSPLYVEYTQNDLLADQPASKEEYFKEWNYYAVSGFDDLFGGNAKRQRVGTVTIRESDTPDNTADGSDYVTFDGIFGAAGTEFGLQTGADMVYYNGYFYDYAALLNSVSVNGMTVYPIFASVTSGGAISLNGRSLLGGMVDDGYLAFVDYGMGAIYDGSMFDGIFVMGFMDITFTTPIGGLVYYKDLLLVDPAADPGLPEQSSASHGLVTMESMRSVMKEFGRISNYVETPDGRMRSAIDRLSERRFRNYMNVSMRVPFCPEPEPVRARVGTVIAEQHQSGISGMERSDLHSRKMEIR